MISRTPLLVAAALLLAARPAAAHPVPRSNHDRTIAVRLCWDGPSSQFVVRVAYRLEVDEYTVVFDDMTPFQDQVDLPAFRDRRSDYYAEFTRLYAPILAGNLVVRANGRPVELTCVHREHTLTDEKGQDLGHLRCDFQFQASFPAAVGEQTLALRESNFELQAGKIDLSIGADPSLKLLAMAAPDAELKKRADTQLRPGDEERLRQVSARFLRNSAGDATSAGAAPPADSATKPAGRVRHDNLLRLFLGSEGGLAWLLLLAAGLGAIHALTPGHGKTLVAAYLVGAEGTTWHALVLGLVTTVTHTGVVFAIAVGLLFVSDEVRQAVAGGLGLAAGLLVLGYGVWALLQRLAGRADHFHLGGSHHHHHRPGHPHDHADHGLADHEHDAEGNAVPRRRPRGWWGLVVLGMSGGMVPCWDAVATLVVAVGTGQVALALPMLLAFSAGLAGVLVLVGVLVVHARGFAVSHWGEGRLVRALPLLSAVAIAALGVWLCYDSVHGGGSP